MKMVKLVLMLALTGAFLISATDEVQRHIVFGDERIGRSPAGQLEFIKGNMQIVELDGRNVLEFAGASAFRLNLDLSERRAKSVAAYLTGPGIDASRLQSRGLGESAPVADNGTPAGRQENRRLVIVLRKG